MSNVKIEGNASGTGTLTIQAPNTNTDRTFSLPDVTGDIVTTGDSGTITAGMLDGAQTGTAPVFGVRAWVNFNGTGTVAIRDSGNVTSITDNTTGDYTVNFTTSMPHTNYAVGIAWSEDNNNSTTGALPTARAVNNYATGSVRFHPVQHGSNYFDCQLLTLIVVG